MGSDGSQADVDLGPTLAAGAGNDGGGLSTIPPETDLILAADLYPGGAEELRTAACAGQAIETEQLPVVLQLVVDVSGSMDVELVPGAGTKWEITREALVSSMDGMRQDSSVGVTYYPNRTTQVNTEAPAPIDTCIDQKDNVSIAMLDEADSAHRQAIADSFAGIELTDPAGTPTHDAVNIALEGLSATAAAGDKYMLLITDGQPTFLEGCLGTGATLYPVDERPIIDAIAAASAQGIKTFVIGSPGSENNEATGADARPWLSEAARVGGTATDGCSDTGPDFCHFDMTQAADFGAALSEALLAITTTLMCNYSLASAPAGKSIDLDTLNMIYTTSDSTEYIVAQNGAETCELGWRLDPEALRVEVCGSTCEQLKADPKGRVELVMGCATYIGVQ